MRGGWGGVCWLFRACFFFRPLLGVFLGSGHLYEGAR